MKYTIDAHGKKIGRVASEAAHLLMGKHTPSFQRHMLADVEVEVTNASGLAITPKKMEQKEYIHYTGHPGGQRRTKLDEIIQKKGHTEALRRAIYGMLPANRLRSKMMKRLHIHE